MKTVTVDAVNLKKGDVLNGRRIKAVHTYGRRWPNGQDEAELGSLTGVLVIAPNPNGYKLDVDEFIGNEKVVVKRPKYNMKYRKKS